MAKDKPGPDPVAALADHAGTKDTLEFSEKILHGRLAFHKGEIVQFEDPAVAAYFDIAFNGTEFTTKTPTRTVTDEELNFDLDDPRGNETIDPHTIIGNGREGVTAGNTVARQAAGETEPPQPVATEEAPLDVHDLHQESEG